MVGAASLGCVSGRYSTEALHAMAPQAGIVDVCVRFPMADPEATVVAYDSKTRTAVSDQDGKSGARGDEAVWWKGRRTSSGVEASS